MNKKNKSVINQILFFLKENWTIILLIILIFILINGLR